MKLKTDADRFIAAQIEGELRPKEVMLAAAYLMPEPTRHGGLVEAATRKAAFAVLTSERLFFIRARVGAFAPLLENQGIDSIEHRDIAGVSTEDGLRIELRSGRMLAYEDTGMVEVVSSQKSFFAKVESRLGRSKVAAAAGVAKQRSELVQFVVVIAVLCAVAIYAFLK